MTKNALGKEILQARTTMLHRLTTLLQTTDDLRTDPIAREAVNANPVLGRLCADVSHLLDAVKMQSVLIRRLTNLTAFTAPPDDEDLRTKQKAAKEAARAAKQGEPEVFTPAYEALFVYMLALEARLADVQSGDHV